MKALCLTGQRFARLVALDRAGTSGRDGITWRCLCDCGGEVIVIAKHLRSGNTKSCGCISSEKTAARNRAGATHGMTGSPEFTVWVNMKERCYNPKHNSYARYGERGITVCEEWRDDFAKFYADMGAKPFPKAEIDRQDNDLGYYLGNCEWVTRETNASNRECSRRITAWSRTQTIAQWAREIGSSRQALRYRLNAGVSPEEALTLPFNKGNKLPGTIA